MNVCSGADVDKFGTMAERTVLKSSSKPHPQAVKKCGFAYLGIMNVCVACKGILRRGKKTLWLKIWSQCCGDVVSRQVCDDAVSRGGPMSLVFSAVHVLLLCSQI